MQGVEIERDERDQICSEIVAAMKEGYGTTFSGAVQKINRVSRAEAYRWMAEDEEFSNAIKEARNVSNSNLVDLAQSNAVTALKNSDPKMTRFVLETLGKNHGYTKRSELSGPDGKPIETQEVNEAKQSLLRGAIPTIAPIGTDSEG